MKALVVIVTLLCIIAAMVCYMKQQYAGVILASLLVFVLILGTKRRW